MSEKSSEMIKKDRNDNRRNSSASSASSLSLFPTPFSSSNAEPDFHQLIKSENWKKIRSYLKSPKAYSLCQQTDSSNLTCLAMALAYMAPLDIIEAIYDIDPSLLSKVDSFGATALHLGCLNGASVESIEFLVRKDNDAARKIDMDHRSALHHAVEFRVCQIEEQSSSSSSYSTAFIDNFDLVRILCEIAPEMIGDSDTNGNSPTDLVQVTKYRSEVDSEKYYRLDCLYQVLKEASIKLYKDNKRAWEAEDVSVLKEASIKLYEDNKRAWEAEDVSSLQTPQSGGTDQSSFMMNLSVLNEQGTDHDNKGRDMVLHESNEGGHRAAAANTMNNHDSKMTVNSSNHSMSTTSDGGAPEA